MADDLIGIGSSDLSARINPLGAELWSMTDAASREYMADADPAFWSGHAPILFPVVGSLNGDILRHRGREYALPRHGFARRSRFDLIDRGADHATFRLRDSEGTRAVYPFAFVLDLAFRIAGSTLHIAASVTNPGMEDLPFSLGFHPAFAWPLPGGADKRAHRVTFAQDEPQDVRRVAAGTGVLLPQSEPTPVRGRELILDEALFAADALIWTELRSRALRYDAPGGAALDTRHSC